MTMRLLQEARNEQAAAKMALFGPQGSGKTSTAAQLAIGISLSYHKGEPVAFFDTEKGSDFALQMFNAEGIKLYQVKSRAFADLLAAVKEAEQAKCSVFIVDSMTHVWNELMEAFCRKKNIKRIEFQHWRELKEQWRGWTDAMLNSPLHMLICGRAGWIYRYEDMETEGGGSRKELITDGTKFKAEGEFGYEPDVLIELDIARENSNRRASKIVHRAVVLKDRTWATNGLEFDWKDRKAYKKGDWNLVYKCFAPYFAHLKIGGPQRAIDTERRSDDLFDGNGDSEYYRRRKEKQVALDDIEALMVMYWPATDQKSKQLKVKILRQLFSVLSWTAMENLPIQRLHAGLQVLQKYEGISKEKPPENEEQVLELLSHASFLCEEDRKAAS